MIHANDDTLDQHLQASGYALVDFTARWCPPCRALKPVLERFGEAHPDIPIIELDVDESPRAAGTYGVQAMPTLVLFRDGRAVRRARGLQTFRQLESLLQGA